MKLGITYHQSLASMVKRLSGCFSTRATHHGLPPAAIVSVDEWKRHIKERREGR